MRAAASKIQMTALPAADLPREAWPDRLRSAVGSALDATVAATMQRLIDTLLFPSVDLESLRAHAAPFLDGPLAHTPRKYFAFVDAAPDRLVSETRYRRMRPGGIVIGRRFVGSYRTYDGAAPDAQADEVLLEHWMHTDTAPRATILAVHGFAMGRPRIDALALFAAEWFRHGLDIALLTLPYHGSRTPKDARISGQRFADPNPARMHDAMRRAIYEMHAVRGWLRAETGAPVGLLGLSLGGYLSALTAGLVEDVDFVMPMVPPVCIGDLAWRSFSHSRRAAHVSASTHGELRSLYRLHSPLTYPLRVPRERVLIIAGRGDRIVPPEHPHAVWRHWGEPDIHWFSGSHLAPFGRERIVAAGVDHLRRLAIL